MMKLAIFLRSVFILSSFYPSSALIRQNGVRRSNGCLPGRNFLSSLRHKISCPSQSSASNEPDNKAMAFLKKMGKVGGSANRDLRFAIGVDEGPSGKTISDGMNVSTFFIFSSHVLLEARLFSDHCLISKLIDFLKLIFRFGNTFRD